MSDHPSVTSVYDHVGTHPDKFYKTTLFESEALLLGLNCLEPGQMQPPHVHADETKFYYVVEGEGAFWLGDQQVTASTGDVVWAPAGVVHGLKNVSAQRLILLVGIAWPP